MAAHHEMTQPCLDRSSCDLCTRVGLLNVETTAMAPRQGQRALGMPYDIEPSCLGWEGMSWSMETQRAQAVLGKAELDRSAIL